MKTRNELQKQVISNLELDAVNAKQLAEKEIKDIKSKTLFQLIKWRRNEKRKKI